MAYTPYQVLKKPRSILSHAEMKSVSILSTYALKKASFIRIQPHIRCRGYLQI